MVCIELEIPDNEVLISSHSFWHEVLNNRDIWDDYDYKSDDDFDMLYEKYQNLEKSMNPEEYQKYKVKSWEKIFTFDDTYKQCVFWNLRKSDIRRVQEFKCR